MKLVKKLVSAVAALTIATSAFVGLTAYAADPTLTGTATLAEDKSSVTLQLAYDAAPANSKVSIIHIKADSDIFDTSALKTAFSTTYYDEDEDDNMEASFYYVIANREDLGLSSSLSNTRKKALTLKFSIANEITLVYNGSTAMKTTEANLATIVVPVKDASKLANGYEFTITASNLGDATQNTGVLKVTSPTLAASTPAVTKYTVTKGTGIKELSAVGEVDEDTEITVTANDPETGYELDKILVNNVAIDGNTFTVTENATVTATFKKINYTVTGTNGITLDKATATYGDTVSITEIAIPNDKELVDITLNGVSKGANFSTFLMPAENVTVTAVLQDKVVEPDPVVTFEGDRVTANNAVGFWSKLSAFENAGTVKAAGFVFANVEEVGKELETSQIQVADTLDLGQTITYEFKNLTGYDKFGLKGMAYIVTDKGPFWSAFMGDGLLTIAR